MSTYLNHVSKTILMSVPTKFAFMEKGEKYVFRHTFVNRFVMTLFDHIY